MLDYHIHTRFCGHAWGEMEEYVEQALRAGLEEMGFSCHYPYPEGFAEPVPDCVIPASLFNEYLSRARTLRERFRGRIRIRIAAEFDWLGPDSPDVPLEVAESLGLDYCLGSLHLVEGVVVDHTPEVLLAGLERKGWSFDDLAELYYASLLELARPGWCTTIGHLDLVKKLAGQAPGLEMRRDHYPEVERVLDQLARSGTAMEINTSGWDKPCAEQYPSDRIIAGAVERGVRITVGSDAHRPVEVGRKFDRLGQILRKHGIRELVRFERLQALPYEIRNGATREAAG